MSNKYQLVRATMEHTLELAPRMREADVREVWATGHLTPLASLQGSLHISVDAGTAIVDGEIMCMYGVGATSLLADLGFPWMLGSDIMEEHARFYLRRARSWIAWAQGRFPVLRNHVDVRNESSIVWLKWMGFEFEEAIPYGPDQVPFYPFELRREPCVTQAQ